MMNRLQLKKVVTSLLKDKELDELLVDLGCFSSKDLINPLFSCLCHSDETVRWHAVSAFGLVVPLIAGKDLEAGRVIMRRFLWMLNDESGGIGWGVPEALGEVMFHQSTLAHEYIHMLVSYTDDDGPEKFQDGNFIELPQLQQGVLWGICRLASKYHELPAIGKVAKNLGCYFSSPDSHVRGLVCRLSGLLGVVEAKAELLKLSSDNGNTRLYLNGSFQDFTVGSLAFLALNSLNSAQQR